MRAGGEASRATTTRPSGSTTRLASHVSGSSAADHNDDPRATQPVRIVEQRQRIAHDAGGAADRHDRPAPGEARRADPRGDARPEPPAQRPPELASGQQEVAAAIAGVQGRRAGLAASVDLADPANDPNWRSKATATVVASQNNWRRCRSDWPTPGRRRRRGRRRRSRAEAARKAVADAKGAARAPPAAPGNSRNRTPPPPPIVRCGPPARCCPRPPRRLAEQLAPLARGRRGATPWPTSSCRRLRGVRAGRPRPATGAAERTAGSAAGDRGGRAGDRRRNRSRSACSWPRSGSRDRRRLARATRPTSRPRRRQQDATSARPRVGHHDPRRGGGGWASCRRSSRSTPRRRPAAPWPPPPPPPPDDGRRPRWGRLRPARERGVPLRPAPRRRPAGIRGRGTSGTSSRWGRGRGSRARVASGEVRCPQTDPSQIQ